MRDWQTTKRPSPVTIVQWGVFLFVIGYGSQAVAIGQQLPFLLTIENMLDPRWRLATAVFWTVIWLGMWLALRQKRPFTRITIPILILTNIVISSLVQSQFPQANPIWGLRLVSFVLILLFSAWALNNQHAKRYFSKGDEA